MKYRILLSISILTLSWEGYSSEPLHLLFWRESDVRDAQHVDFQAHPFAEEELTVLLPSDPEKPSLWRMPTDVVPLEDGDVRVYYQRVEKTLENWVDQRVWRLGILKPDGEFLLPDLGLFAQPWPGPENTLLQRSPYQPTWGGFNVFQIVGTHEEGFRLLYWDQPKTELAGALLAESTDGIHWKKDETHAVFTEHNDAYSLLREKERDGYLLYQTTLADWPDKPFRDNLPGKRRVISLRTSPNLADWSPQKIVLQPDEMDAPTTEFYLLKAFWFFDRYVGLLMKYYADPDQPDKHSGIIRYELVFSDDGRHWERPYRGTDLAAWSYAHPFVHQGKLCFVAHDDKRLVLFKKRPDGLASCGATGKGSFWTPEFEVSGRSLFLNADGSKGSIGVAVLDETGVIIKGFEAAKCGIEATDSTDIPLRWGEKDLQSLKGKRVHLRFTLENSRIYSLYEPKS